MNKPLHQLRDEFAYEVNEDTGFSDHEPKDFIKGFDAATDLVFERIVGALKEVGKLDFEECHQAAEWITENKDRILK